MPGISYQMYCSRDHGIEETLKMLAEAGYDAVEGYGPMYEDLDATKAMLDANGLSMPTGHFAIEVAEDTAKTLEICEKLGIKTVIVPFIMPDDRPSDSAGWAAFGERLAAAGKPIVDAGLKFGWHNHDFEFDAQPDGKLPLDLIMDGGDVVGLELDLGWTIRAGKDPVEWINKYADRLVAVHIKDRAPEGENTQYDGWADVGDGTVDWAPIHAALQSAGVDRYVIENDHPADHAVFAKRSLDAVKKF